MTDKPLTPEEVLRQHAEGRIEHRLGGMCPDPVEGPDTRDPACKVCIALDAARCADPDEGRVDFFATTLQEGRPVTVFPGDESAAIAAAWAIGLTSFSMSAPSADPGGLRAVGTQCHPGCEMCRQFIAICCGDHDAATPTDD
jgi:hypothetical protein